MATCKDCIHVEVCRYYTNELAKANGIPLKLEEVERLLECDDCENFKDRARFVKLKSAVWCKHKPELSKMEEFHKQGIGLGMSENSVFWACSNCGVWGSPIYSFCPHCGARITKEREENA